MPNSHLKIAVNTRLLLKDKLEGIGWFSYNVMKHMVLDHPEVTFYFLFDRKYHPEFIFAPNVIPVVIYPMARHPILWYIWYEWSIPRALRKINPDVFLSLDSYSSLSTEYPSVTVIHDIAFQLFDDHLPLLTEKFMRHFVPKYVQKARQIVTVSHATQRDLIQYYGADPERITVSNNATSDTFRPIEIDEQQAHRNRHTDGCQYFLYVGSIHPRKNVLNLLKAFEHYKDTYPNDHKLALIGRWAWDYDAERAYIKQMKHRSDVILIAHLKHEALRNWYGSAISLLFLSWYEGFGIPLIESIACHTPIIASDIPSMREVAADAALYAPPDDIVAIAECMHQITDPQVSTQLHRHFEAISQRYQWSNAAQNVWTAILKAIN